MLKPKKICAILFKSKKGGEFMNADLMINLMSDIEELYKSVDFENKAKVISNAQRRLYDMIYCTDDIKSEELAYVTMLDFDMLKSELNNAYTVFDLKRYQDSLILLKQLLKEEISKLEK